MNFDAVYFEKDIFNYSLGKELKEQFYNIPWIEIENHNKIEFMQKKDNSEFAAMKRNVIIGIRKTHNYKENHKISDFLVPFTSSGCTAMCLYCYLVCNYNKCSYLRLFVNREKMLDKMVKTSLKSDNELTFEIGSNSDLVLENTITKNLEWVIPEFTKTERGLITFPTKFDMVDTLLNLEHRKRVIFRMSVNPQKYINRIELGTSSLEKRITALNKMSDAGYVTGILIAPVILLDDWKEQYSNLIDILADTLSNKTKENLLIEIIFMTYSYIHRAINSEAFPNAVELYDKQNMVGRGMGKYCYNQTNRQEGENFLKNEIEKKLPKAKIIYFS